MRVLEQQSSMLAETSTNFGHESYFRALFGCMCTSLSLLVITHILISGSNGNAPQWMTIIAGVAPLAYYHLIYLSRRARHGLSQSAIDSVYYFGFLITIAALGISAVSIARSGALVNINTVVYQFGVGLFATGYAVVARMHLSSISKALDDASPDMIIDKYVQKSKLLVDSLDLTLRGFSELTNKSRLAIEGMDALTRTAMERTTETADRAQILATKAVQQAARTFEDEMKSVLAMTKDGLIQMKGLIADTAFTSEREELARGIKATIDATAELNKSLATLTDSAREGNTSLRAASNANSALAQTASNLDDALGKMVAEDGSIPKAAQISASAAESLAASCELLDQSATRLRVSAKDAAEGSATHMRLAKLVKKVDDELIALSTASERFSIVLESVKSNAETGAATIKELDRVSKVLPELSEGAERLGNIFVSTAAKAEGFRNAVEQITGEAARNEAATSQVVASIELMSEKLSVAVAQTASIQSNTAGAAASVRAAQSLLESAASLERSILAVNAAVQSIPLAVKEMERGLSDGAMQIKTSVTVTSKQLSEDVERSSAAASLLTAKLVEVAQVIIDSTSAHQQGGMRTP